MWASHVPVAWDIGGCHCLSLDFAARWARRPTAVGKRARRSFTACPAPRVLHVPFLSSSAPLRAPYMKSRDLRRRDPRARKPCSRRNGPRACQGSGAAGDPSGQLPAEVRGQSTESGGRDGVSRVHPRTADGHVAPHRLGPCSGPSPAFQPRPITDWVLVTCPRTEVASKWFRHFMCFPRPRCHGAGVACSGAGVRTTGCCAFTGASGPGHDRDDIEKL